MTRPRPRIGSELLPVILILGCLVSSWLLIVTMHRRMVPPRKAPSPARVVAVATPPPQVAIAPPAPVPPKPAPKPKAKPKPRPLPPPAPPAEDPTKKELLRIGAAEAERLLEARQVEKKATDLERERDTARAEAERLRNQGRDIEAQVATLSDRAQLMEKAIDELAIERDVLAQERDATKAALAKTKNRSSYAILPNRSPNGTWRRPIMLECRNGTVTLQPKGQKFSLLDLSGAMGVRSNPLIIAVVRELIRTQGKTGPDGSLSTPYIFFVVRPDGIRPYYEARARLEALGIAFGYELVDQNLEIDFPDLDNPEEWDGTPHIPNVPALASRSGSSEKDPFSPLGSSRGAGGQGSGHNADDYRWPASPAGSNEGAGDLPAPSGMPRARGRGNDPGLEPFDGNDLGDSPRGTSAGSGDPLGPGQFGPAAGFGAPAGGLAAPGVGTGPGSTPGMLPPTLGPGTPGMLPAGRASTPPAGGPPARSGSSAPALAPLSNPSAPFLPNGPGTASPAGRLTHGLSSPFAPQGTAADRAEALQGQAGDNSNPGGSSNPAGSGNEELTPFPSAPMDPNQAPPGELGPLPGLDQPSELAGQGNGSAGPGQGSAGSQASQPGNVASSANGSGAQAGRAGQGSENPGRGNTAANPQQGVELPISLLNPGMVPPNSNAANGSTSTNQRRRIPVTESAEEDVFGDNSPDAQGSESGQSGAVADGKPVPRRRKRDSWETRKIDVPLEIVVSCGPDGVVIHPGGYRLSAKALEGKDEILVRSLKGVLRLRQQVDPMIRPKPSIRFLVEPGGEKIYALARRRTMLSGIDWPTTLQVADMRVLDLFSRGPY